MPEPWLRNTHLDLHPIPRAVVHALELAHEDASHWTAGLTPTELFALPHTLPSVAFQLRHIARSLDRLLTYTEGNALSATQLDALQTEPDPTPDPHAEFAAAIAGSLTRIVAIPPGAFFETRFVGRDRLPTTVAALLIHCADHTQRHAGQLVTTARLLLASRRQEILSSP